MTTVPLLTALAKHLGCEVGALQEKLNHPNIILSANLFLNDKTIRTNYLDNNNEYREIKSGQIGPKSAREQYAYEGFLGISVEVHFYCRRRIRLQYPRMRCLAVHSKSSHVRYYPLGKLKYMK
jgi:hypothetical protein